MPVPSSQSPEASYDSRWFIWTIVFLVVTGVSLVSYIVLSDPNDTNIGPVVTTHAIASHKNLREVKTAEK